MLLEGILRGKYHKQLENLMDACLFLQPSIGQHVQLMVCCNQHFNYNLALADVAT